MKPVLLSLLTLASLLVSTPQFAGTAAEAVMVSDGYTRAVPPGQPNSASFMLLSNSSATPHALVAAASSVSKVTELHTHTMAEGMMQMRQVEQIEIPANGTTRLQPGGLHLMLIGLTQQLKPGDEVALTLSFEDGSELKTTLPVRMLQMQMMQPGQGGMMHGKMMH